MNFFDRLKELNIRPIVELGAMPLELASEDKTTFRWKMNVSKPKDYNEWYDLIFAFVSHLKPNEVMYVEIQKKAPKGYLGAEKDEGAKHLRELLK